MADSEFFDYESDLLIWPIPYIYCSITLARFDFLQQSISWSWIHLATLLLWSLHRNHFSDSRTAFLFELMIWIVSIWTVYLFNLVRDLQYCLQSIRDAYFCLFSKMLWIRQIIRTEVYCFDHSEFRHCFDNGHYLVCIWSLFNCQIYSFNLLANFIAVKLWQDIQISGLGLIFCSSCIPLTYFRFYRFDTFFDHINTDIIDSLLHLLTLLNCLLCFAMIYCKSYVHIYCLVLNKFIVLSLISNPLLNSI